MKLIQFSSQNGSTQAGEKIRPYQIGLNKVFNVAQQSELKTVDALSIIFRVSGKHRDFGSEGPEFLEKTKSGRFVTIDLAIPESKWRDVSVEEFEAYLIQGIRDCYVLLADLADELGEVTGRAEMDKKFNEGMRLFKESFDIA